MFVASVVANMLIELRLRKIQKTYNAQTIFNSYMYMYLISMPHNSGKIFVITISFQMKILS